jgi:hypothetical protein
MDEFRDDHDIQALPFPRLSVPLAATMVTSQISGGTVDAGHLEIVSVHYLPVAIRIWLQIA